MHFISVKKSFSHFKKYVFQISSFYFSIISFLIFYFFLLSFSANFQLKIGFGVLSSFSSFFFCPNFESTLWIYTKCSHFFFNYFVYDNFIRTTSNAPNAYPCNTCKNRYICNLKMSPSILKNSSLKAHTRHTSKIFSDLGQISKISGTRTRQPDFKDLD